MGQGPSSRQNSQISLGRGHQFIAKACSAVGLRPGRENMSEGTRTLRYEFFLMA